MENKAKNLPKTRAIKSHYKSMKDIYKLRKVYEFTVLQHEERLEQKYVSGSLSALINVYFDSFESYGILSHIFQDATYGRKSLAALEAYNELFRLQVKARFDEAAVTKKDLKLPLPDYLPQHFQRQQERVVGNAIRVKTPWHEWLCLLCYAMAIRDQQSVDYLLQYTEREIWVANTNDGKNSSVSEFPMFCMRFIKGMLFQQDNCHRLYEQLTRVYSQNRDPSWGQLLEPFYFLAIEDEQGFSKAIAQATKAHKKIAKDSYMHYFKGGNYFICPFILGASVMAYDKYGWLPADNNDYLYPWWIFNRPQVPVDLAFKY